MAGQGKKMMLRIIDCKPVYHGTNKKGDEYSIFEIRASKPEGDLINEKLRSFIALPVGQSIEVTVVPFVSDKHGKSFTLYPTKQRAEGTVAAVNDHAEQLEALHEKVRLLAERVATLEGTLAQVVGGKLMAAVDEGIARGLAAPDAATADLDAKFGADPPFE